MHIDHHDLGSEFPDMRDAIEALQAENPRFGSLLGSYNRLTGKVEDLEEHDMPVADFHQIEHIADAALRHAMASIGVVRLTPDVHRGSAESTSEGILLETES